MIGTAIGAHCDRWRGRPLRSGAIRRRGKRGPGHRAMRGSARPVRGDRGRSAGAEDRIERARRPGCRAMIGPSDGRQEAGGVEHVIAPAKRARRVGFGGEEGAISRDLIRGRCAPRPGADASLEGPGRDRRDRRLSRAPGPRAGGARRGRRERAGLARQVVEQGLDQRGEPGRIVLGGDEMQAARLRHRRREQDERQERRNGSRRREGPMPGWTRSRHSSGIRGTVPPSVSEGGRTPAR
jgi:hypothetical protein